jgi:hypothetical protein
MWRPVSLTANLGYDIFFVVFIEANASIESVDSLSVFWIPRGALLLSGLECMIRYCL